MPTTLNSLENLTFDNHFARLGNGFYSRVTPSPLKKPHLVSFSAEAAKLIGLAPAEAQRAEFLDYFNGNTLFAGSEPLAMLYCGHQFGQYVPLIEQDNNLETAVEQAKAVLQNYQTQYETDFSQGMCNKLGLENNDQLSKKLTDDILLKLHQNQVDYTCFFSALSTLKSDDPTQKYNDKPIRELFLDPSAFDQWAINYRLSLKQEARDDSARHSAMQQVNPQYILRNHLAHIAIEKAENGDFSEVDRLLNLLKTPFKQQHDMESYAERPPAWASKISISCSS